MKHIELIQKSLAKRGYYAEFSEIQEALDIYLCKKADEVSHQLYAGNMKNDILGACDYDTNGLTTLIVNAGARIK